MCVFRKMLNAMANLSQRFPAGWLTEIQPIGVQKRHHYSFNKCQSTQRCMQSIQMSGNNSSLFSQPQLELAELVVSTLRMIFRINRQLTLDESTLNQFKTLFGKIHSMAELNKMCTVVQFCSDFDDIYDVIDKEFMLDGDRPCKEEFKKLPPSQQLAWVKYYSILKVREGIGALNAVLKNYKNLKSKQCRIIVSATAGALDSIGGRISKSDHTNLDAVSI